MVLCNVDGCEQIATSHHKGMCSGCYQQEYRLKNIEKIKIQQREQYYKNGGRPMSENKSCSSFLGVHVAERVLSKVFKDVKTMPYGNSGYDFICNHGKKIDVKSGCRKHDKHSGWEFPIKYNIAADYFLLLGFDSRENLNIEKAWLIPGKVLNFLSHTSIADSTMKKWEQYEISADKINNCCDSMRGN